MGGTLTAEETPGGGLTVVIDLPAGEPEPVPEPAAAGRSGGAGVTRVLAVDDDPAILRTLQINLRARTYEVRDGPRRPVGAASRSQSELPDLVLLDLGLPDLDGVAVLTQLRSFSTVPVIVLSARHESDDKVEALDLGADDYVTKPFGMEELLARVRAALRHAGDRRASDRPVVETESLRLDVGEATATRNGTEVHLTPTEWRIVEALTRRPGTAGPADRPAARGLGAGVPPGDQLPPGLPGPAAAQARGRARPAAALHDRTRRRLPLRPLSLALSARWRPPRNGSLTTRIRHGFVSLVTRFGRT